MTWFLIIVCAISIVCVGIVVKNKISKKKKDPCDDGTCDKDEKKDPCDDGTCDKDEKKDPCDDGTCDKDEPVTPEPIKSISVKILSVVPNNSGTNVPEGVFCTRTSSITAIDEITGCADCVIKREWFDNDKLIASDVQTIKPPFFTGHFIKYQVTVGDLCDTFVVKIL